MYGAEAYEYFNEQLKESPNNWFLLSFVNYQKSWESKFDVKQQTRRERACKAASKQFTSAVDLWPHCATMTATIKANNFWFFMAEFNSTISSY